jgi:hypothetical protein
MAHSHSTERYYTRNPQSGKSFLYSLYQISPFTIQYIQFFRYSVDTKTLIPKTEIIFSKQRKIAKIAQKKIWGVAPGYA